MANTAVVSAATSDRVETWVGSHSRLVWLQDHGNGADTLAHGKNLMLYGYDSRDGRGERPLLPAVSNYFRPMITPDGEQVIVSNRLTRKMYLVDWQSGKMSELGEGVAVAVWEDPVPSFLLRRTTTWVYCFSGLQPENKYGTSQPLYRFPLDKPKKKELIWDKTNMAWDNVQLSRDGQLLGGLFPWPDGGVLWTKDRRWQRLGNGCWTSLSPDNSKLLWIFDGLHRNIQVHDIGAGKNWTVNINGAPGVGGFEVYHPRWSNHPRFFVITGPYEKGDGGNRIGGGGEKVEIFIGRFDEKVEKVEHWLQVTSNGKADFYPDLWVNGGHKAQLSRNTEKKISAGQTQQWPAGREQLIFVWENMKAANQLDEKSPVGFFQCNIELRGRALYNRQLQLVTGGGFGETGEAGRKIGAALASTGHAAIEFVVLPQPGQRGGLLTLAAGEKVHLQLAQEGETLLVHSPGAGRSVSWPGVLAAGKARHLVVNFDGRAVELFVDGRSGGKKELPVTFTSAAIDGLGFGDRSGTVHATLSGIALYNQQLAADVIASNSTMALPTSSTAPAIDKLVVEGTLVESTEIPAADSIGAYRRSLVVNIYEVGRVIQGSYDKKRALVAEWAILDRDIVKSYRSPARAEQLVLEKFSDHPELEGERQMMDVFEPDLEMYYRLPDIAVN